MKLGPFSLSCFIIRPRAFFIIIILSLLAAGFAFDNLYTSLPGYNYGDAYNHYNVLDVRLFLLSYFHQLLFEAFIVFVILYYLFRFVIFLLKRFLLFIVFMIRASF